MKRRHAVRVAARRRARVRRKQPAYATRRLCLDRPMKNVARRAAAIAALAVVIVVAAAAADAGALEREAAATTAKQS